MVFRALQTGLAEILKKKGLISDEGLARILSLSRERGSSLYEVCIEEGIVTERDVAIALAEHLGLEFFEARGFDVDEGLLREIPLEVLNRYEFLPIEKRDGVLHIAVADPTDVPLLDELEFVLDTSLKIGISTRSEIREALKRAIISKRVLKEVRDDLDGGTDIRVIPEGDGVLTPQRIAEKDSPVVRLLDSSILDALEKKASDIHIETSERGVYIKYRIDGVLYTVSGPLKREIQSHLISRLKVMADLDISERRIPQDGRFRVSLKDDRTIDFRVSIMPSIYGEDAVIRILDKEAITKSLGELRLDMLGFDREVLRRLKKMIREPYGMFLVTGPTGSGKTTTIYAAINEINTGEEKIITIEDPVEYNLKGVLQIPVNEKKGLTFAKGLRSILRHDPDKIMVGEIRDIETAQIAVQAALTGHIVFTTVHANNAFDVIGRFIHMGIEPYNFVSSLNCILAQRLVRRICKGCKRPVSVDEEILKESGLDPETCRGYTFYEGRGCRECNYTGYRGRKAIAELLELTDEIREMIIARHSLALIKRKAREEGMVSLRESAIREVLQGETTLKEINRVTFVE